LIFPLVTPFRLTELERGSRERRLHALLTSSRAAVRAMSIVGAAAIVAATPALALSPRWVEPARALGFLAVCSLLLGTFGVRRQTLRPSRPAHGGVAAFALFAVWLPTLPDGARTMPVVWSVLVAAAVEEVVYRLQLPHAITILLERSFAPAVATWLACSASQLSFALSHVAIGGGLDTSAALLASLRLLGAGFFLAGLQLVAGLPVTISAHALANLAMTASLSPSAATALSARILVLCVLGALHMTASQYVAGCRCVR
jgi:hypothetical protein